MGSAGRASIDDSAAARARFEAFLDGLEHGVDLSEARDGESAALLVSET